MVPKRYQNRKVFFELRSLKFLDVSKLPNFVLLGQCSFKNSSNKYYILFEKMCHSNELKFANGKLEFEVKFAFGHETRMLAMLLFCFRRKIWKNF